MIWTQIFLKNQINSKLSFYKVKTRVVTWYLQTKLKIVTNKLKNDTSTVWLIFIKYAALIKNINQLWSVKFNYNELFFLKKIELKEQKEYIIFNVVLNKKQTYICITTNHNKIIFQNTNGILLKQGGISEKCRKKDFKSNLSLVKSSIIFFKKNFQKKNVNVFVRLKKTKPFINKLVKVLLSGVDSSKRISLFLNPKISFSIFKFKKLKSIKRRLRKKYKMLDF